MTLPSVKHADVCQDSQEALLADYSDKLFVTKQRVLHGPHAGCVYSLTRPARILQLNLEQLHRSGDNYLTHASTSTC